MIKLPVIVLCCLSCALALEGPDYMMNADLYVPGSGSYNQTGSYIGKAGIAAIFRHASLYGINALKWEFAGIRISSRYGAASLAFRRYGVDDLYSAACFSMFISKALINKISAGVGYSRLDNKYGDGMAKLSANVFSIGIGASWDKFEASILTENLAFEKRSYSDNPEILAGLRWQANDILSIYGVYFNDGNNRNRVAIGQDLNLTESFWLNAGLFSNPEIYFAGIEMVYNRFHLGYTYFDIGGLPDCSRITLSVR
jgi:hypothetical protein